MECYGYDNRDTMPNAAKMATIAAFPEPPGICFFGAGKWGAAGTGTAGC